MPQARIFAIMALAAAAVTPSFAENTLPVLETHPVQTAAVVTENQIQSAIDQTVTEQVRREAEPQQRGAAAEGSGNASLSLLDDPQFGVRNAMIATIMADLSSALEASFASEMPREIRQVLAEAITAEVEPEVVKAFEVKPKKEKKRMIKRIGKGVRTFANAAYSRSPLPSTFAFVRHPKQNWRNGYGLANTAICLGGIGPAYVLCALMGIGGQIIAPPQAQAQTFQERRHENVPRVKETGKPLTLREAEKIATSSAFGRRYSLAMPFDQQPNTIFGNQPRYDEDPGFVSGLRMATAGQLGLTGVVYNEVPGRTAIAVRLDQNDRLRYDQARGWYWLIGCRYDGKDFLNRIQPLSPPATQVPPAQVQPPITVNVPPQAPPKVSNNLKVPLEINLNLTGLPQAQAYPAQQEITYRVIIENRTKQTKADAIKKIGFGLGAGMGGGGVLAAGIGVARMPGASVEKERVRQGGNVKVAEVNANASVRGKEIEADATKVVSGNQLQGVIHTNETSTLNTRIEGQTAENVNNARVGGDIRIAEIGKEQAENIANVEASADVNVANINKEAVGVIAGSNERIAAGNNQTSVTVAQTTAQGLVDAAKNTLPEVTNVSFTDNSQVNAHGGAGGSSEGGSSTVSVVGGNAAGGSGGIGGVATAAGGTANNSGIKNGNTIGVENGNTVENGNKINAGSSSTSQGGTSSADNGGQSTHVNNTANGGQSNANNTGVHTTANGGQATGGTSNNNGVNTTANGGQGGSSTNTNSTTSNGGQATNHNTSNGGNVGNVAGGNASNNGVSSNSSSHGGNSTNTANGGQSTANGGQATANGGNVSGSGNSSSKATGGTGNGGSVSGSGNSHATGGQGGSSSSNSQANGGSVSGSGNSHSGSSSSSGVSGSGNSSSNSGAHAGSTANNTGGNVSNTANGGTGGTSTANGGQGGNAQANGGQANANNSNKNQGNTNHGNTNNGNTNNGNTNNGNTNNGNVNAGNTNNGNTNNGNTNNGNTNNGNTNGGNSQHQGQGQGQNQGQGQHQGQGQNQGQGQGQNQGGGKPSHGGGH